MQAPAPSPPHTASEFRTPEPPPRPASCPGLARTRSRPRAVTNAGRASRGAAAPGAARPAPARAVRACRVCRSQRGPRAAAGALLGRGEAAAAGRGAGVAAAPQRRAPPELRARRTLSSALERRRARALWARRGARWRAECTRQRLRRRMESMSCIAVLVLLLATARPEHGCCAAGLPYAASKAARAQSCTAKHSGGCLTGPRIAWSATLPLPDSVSRSATQQGRTPAPARSPVPRALRRAAPCCSATRRTAARRCRRAPRPRRRAARARTRECPAPAPAPPPPAPRPR